MGKKSRFAAPRPTCAAGADDELSVVMAERPGQRLIAVYHGGLLVEVPAEQGGMVQIVNASGGEVLHLKLALAPLAASACDVFGAPVAVPLPAAGLTEVAVPEAGVLVLRF